jgi:hypothetical protein
LPTFSPDLPARSGERGDRLVDVTRGDGLRRGAVHLLVQELGERTGVLRHHLDLALLQRRLVQLAVADLLDGRV